MKIIIDMNLSPRRGDYLRENGLEAVHWSSIGSPDDLDAALMAYAKKYDFVILTNDLDFGLILADTHYEKPRLATARFVSARFSLWEREECRAADFEWLPCRLCCGIIKVWRT